MHIESEIWSTPALLQALQQGDETAFNSLYNLHSKTLYRKIMRMVGDEEIAKELLQDLFFKLWDKRTRIDESRSIRSYLYTIAVNLVYDHFRKAAKDKTLEARLMAMSVEYYTHSEEALLAKDNQKLIEQIIHQLPPQRRQVYMLCKLDGMSYEEAAMALHISAATIRDHIVKANKTIREYLQANPDITIFSLIVWGFIHLP